MAFRVNDFVSNLPGGGARPNLFEVTIDLPTAIKAATQNGEQIQKFKYLCQTSQIPGATLGVAQMNYFGRLVKFAGNRVFADWTATIINDNDFAIRRIMESWMDQISGNITNTKALSAAAGYKATADVVHYNSSGVAIREYKIRGLFPTELAAIALDWNTNDAIETFDMTFSITDWVSQDAHLGASLSTVIDTAQALNNIV